MNRQQTTTLWVSPLSARPDTGFEACKNTLADGFEVRGCACGFTYAHTRKSWQLLEDRTGVRGKERKAEKAEGKKGLNKMREKRGSGLEWAIAFEHENQFSVKT